MTSILPKDFKTLLDKLPNTLILTSHINPDGDGLGAMFAMGEALKTRGRDIYYVLDEPVRDYYEVMNEHQYLEYKLPNTKDKVAIITFDCGNYDRIALPSNFVDLDYVLVNLDHHLSNDLFADYNLVVTSSPASCALVYEALQYMKIEITPTIATALYMGIMYDTGRFAYSKDSYVFELAADLLKLQADHWLVYTALYRHNNFTDFKTIGQLYSLMQEHDNGKLVTLDIDAEISPKINLEETENLINQISNIKNLEVAIVFKYLREDLTKISFRSRGNIDVCELAQSVGGGGHRNASGALMNCGFKKAKETILNRAKQMLLISSN